jgi:Ca2+-binding RTX toxin-like protein
MATINGTIYDDVIKVGSGSAYYRNGKKQGNLTNSTDLDDIISTDAGNDRIWAGDGNDTINAGNGSDLIYGEGGDDKLVGGNGKDTIYGGVGNDTIWGDDKKVLDTAENGVDALYGGSGDDVIYGGNGADWIVGGADDDVLVGGNGGDTFDFNAVWESEYTYGSPGTFTSGTPWAKPWDIIVAFTSGSDRIDLSSVPLSGPGPSQLVWRGALGTDGSAGQTDAERGGPSLAHSVWTDTDRKFLYADVNGDGKADMKIQVSGVAGTDLLGVELNDGPIFTTIPPAGGLDVPENSLPTLVVYDADATDPEGDAISYSLTGADALLFTISADGEIRFVDSPNYEAPTDAGGDNVYNVTIVASDGFVSTTQAVTINVSDVNEAPTLTVDQTPVNFAEDTAIGTVLADVDGSDPDAGGGNDDANDFENLSYSIRSVNGATSGAVFDLFAIDSATGEISLNGAFDFETQNTYSIVVRVSDGPGAYDEQTVEVNVSDVNESVAPTINTPGVLYWTDNSSGVFSPINRISFQDADSAGAIVRVTLTMDDVGDDLIAATGGGVTVGGSGTNVLTLDGTMAAINAYLFAGNVGWDPNVGGGSSGVLTVTIDDNGTDAGGNVVTATPINVAPVTPNFVGNSNNDFSGVNFTDIDTDPDGNEPGAGDGDDVMVTSWSHQPLSTAQPVVYNGGAGGTDTITLVMTPDQLAAILAVTADQNDLRDYFDGSPGGDSLGLSDTLWNADVQGFEAANISLATGYGVGTFSINSFFDSLPPADTSPDADTADDLVIGTGGNDNLTGGAGAGGLNGDDVLVGLAGNDVLDGGSGADLLIGGDGDDTLTGGIGMDVVSGGRGDDTFVFNAGDTGANADTLVDYSFVEGDALELSGLLDAGFDPSSSAVSDFVRLQVSGSDIVVQVDLDGTTGGANWVNVATLANYNNLGAVDVVRVHFEANDYTLML